MRKRGATKKQIKKQKNYGGVPDTHARTDFAVVCDYCFQKMHPDYFPDLAEKARQELKS